MYAFDRAAGGRPRVLFVLMPWAAVQHGALGVSTLKAILEREGIAADVLYLNVEFARRVRTDFYHFISARGGSRFNGEVFFTPHAFGLPLQPFIEEKLQAYYAEVFTSVDQTVGSAGRERDIGAFLAYCAEVCGTIIPKFLDDAIAEVPWSEYDVVGFSLMFDQTLASLALAKRLKSIDSSRKILFGGAGCEDEMGVELARCFGAVVDVVAIGEADATIADLVRALRSSAPLDPIPGLAFQRGGSVQATGPASPLQNLDWLPVPDYDDYVAQVDGVEGWERSLYFETSRGCWWGQKHLCSFCGLNSNGLAFRRKSPARAIAEIAGLVERHGVTSLRAADNILDLEYFRSVLPTLAQWNATRGDDAKLSMFYEIKSNVRKEQLRLMKAAGITRVQPGIESFSDNILHGMDKGSTGLQQIQFLKWATEIGIDLTYGILHSNPGDTAADYEEMRGVVPFIAHLQPPAYIVPMILERFSPYFNDPVRHGITNIRPSPAYSAAFPGEGVRREKLAYMFTYEHAMHADGALQSAMAECLTAMRAWRSGFIAETLVYDELEDGAICVVDRRGGRTSATRLDAQQARIFRLCDEIRSFARLREESGVAEAPLRAFLEMLVARRWMYRDGRDRYLALPVRRPLDARVLASLSRNGGRGPSAVGLEASP